MGLFDLIYVVHHMWLNPVPGSWGDHLPRDTFSYK